MLDHDSMGAKNSVTNSQVRFARLVEKPDDPSGCWLWKGSTRTGGYGQFKIGGRATVAHRYSLMLAGRPVLPGLKVLHTCDTPRCVNPDHLVIGSQAENIADRDARGRTARGERAARAKLTDAAVLELRLLASSGGGRTELADRFGISPLSVRAIAAGKTWRHLLPDASPVSVPVLGEVRA